MKNQLLPVDDIDALVDACIASNVAEADRRCLLIRDDSFRIRLPTTNVPLAQLQSDLSVLNHPDHWSMFLSWLMEAQEVAGSHLESEVFARFARRLRELSSPHDAPIEDPWNMVLVYGKLAILVDDAEDATRRVAREFYGTQILPRWWKHFQRLDDAIDVLEMLAKRLATNDRYPKELDPKNLIVVVDRKVVPSETDKVELDWWTLASEAPLSSDEAKELRARREKNERLSGRDICRLLDQAASRQHSGRPSGLTTPAPTRTA